MRQLIGFCSHKRTRAAGAYRHTDPQSYAHAEAYRYTGAHSNTHAGAYRYTDAESTERIGRGRACRNPGSQSASGR